MPAATASAPHLPTTHAQPAWSPRDFVSAAVLLGVAIWAYWLTLVQLWREWDRNPNYSVGIFVPFAAVYILLQQRHEYARLQPRVNWAGLLLICAGFTMRIEGLRRIFESAERYSFILVVAGIVMLIFGWQVLWRARWMMLFLTLMIPLPGKIHNMIAGPMQNWATQGTVFTLELIGTTVEQQGNVLLLDGDTEVGIAEACSGLRMLTAFVFVACVFAFLVSRPTWQKAVLVIASIPIAIFANLVRLTVTALLFRYVDSKKAEHFFHDFAGVTMMPIAVACLLLLLWIMSNMVTSESAGRAPVAAK